MVVDMLIGWGTDRAVTIMPLRGFVSAENDLVHDVLKLSFIDSRDPKKHFVKTLTGQERAEAWNDLMELYFAQHPEARRLAQENQKEARPLIKVEDLRKPGEKEN